MGYCKLVIKGKLCVCVCVRVRARAIPCGRNALCVLMANVRYKWNRKQRQTKQYLLLDLLRLQTALYLYLDKGE